jgi:hypothetical protein
VHWCGGKGAKIEFVSGNISLSEIQSLPRIPGQPEPYSIFNPRSYDTYQCEHLGKERELQVYDKRKIVLSSIMMLRWGPDGVSIR